MNTDAMLAEVSMITGQLSARVAMLAGQLKAVTDERDELAKKLAALEPQPIDHPV